MLDLPNSRSSHRQPTPRGGGVIFVHNICSFLIGYLSHFVIDASFLLLISLPLAIIGLLDDRYDLPAVMRFGTQIFTAIFILFFSPVFSQFLQVTAFGFWSLALLSIFLLILITAIINFTNFMDGLDGLVCGCMIVSIASLSFSLKAPWPIWTLIGFLLISFFELKSCKSLWGCW